jgi:outer membrane pore protein F
MIKRNLLALAIPALLMASSVNAAGIYNENANNLDLHFKVVSMRHWKKQPNSNRDSRLLQFEADNIDQTYAQIGLRGRKKISDWLTGYSRWDYRSYANNELHQIHSSTLAYAGLNFSNTSSLDYGRNYGILHDVASLSDLNHFIAIHTWAGRYDLFMNNRTNGVLTYRNSNFFGLVDGLKVGVQYQGHNIGTPKYYRTHNQEGLGFSLGYDYGKLGVIGAYSKTKRSYQHAAFLTDDLRHWVSLVYNNGEHPEVWAVGLKYGDRNDHFYLSTVYCETRNMNYYGTSRKAIDKTKNFEATASYQFDFGLRPSITYVKSYGIGLTENNPHIPNHANLVDDLTLGVSYYFDKTFSVFGKYMINMIDNNDYVKASHIGIGDKAELGIAYQF